MRNIGQPVWVQLEFWGRFRWFADSRFTDRAKRVEQQEQHFVANYVATYSAVVYGAGRYDDRERTSCCSK